MTIPVFEPSQYEIILAQSPAAVLTQHTISGRLYISELHWRCSGPGVSFDNADAGKAWAAYMEKL